MLACLARLTGRNILQIQSAAPPKVARARKKKRQAEKEAKARGKGLREKSGDSSLPTKGWYYYNKETKEHVKEPVTMRQLEEAWARGAIDGKTFVWCEGMSDWKPIQEKRELHARLGEGGRGRSRLRQEDRPPVTEFDKCLLHLDGTATLDDKINAIEAKCVQRRRAPRDGRIRGRRPIRVGTMRGTAAADAALLSDRFGVDASPSLAGTDATPTRSANGSGEMPTRWQRL